MRNGVLVEETYRIFACWDLSATLRQNLSRIREENPIGATNSAWLKEIVATLADILTFTFPGLPATTISGTSISVTVPHATNVTALAPTYTTLPGITGVPSSGTARNFTTPQTYVINGSNLTGWSSVTIPATSAGIVTITPGSPSDHVSIAIPDPGGNLFVRLKVSE